MDNVTQFNRFNGIIAMLAGLLLVAADVVYAFFASDNVAQMTPGDRLSGYFFLAGALLLTYTAVSLSAFHREKAGIFGSIAFLIAALGCALMVASDWTEIFALPYFVENGVTEPGGTLMTGYMLNFLTYTAGWLLSGIVMLLVNKVPRLAIASMFLGIVLVFGLGDLTKTYRLLDLVAWFFWYGSFIWMGWAMFSYKEDNVPATKTEMIAIPA